MTTQHNVRSNWNRWFAGNIGCENPCDHPQVPKEAEPYVVDDNELVEAINLAIYLQRPLLLEGEAGCGKTRLAMAIAYELGLPFYRWDIRSTSKAKEGLYEYDALLRLHDVQVKQAQGELDRDPTSSLDYIRYGALGNAFQLPNFPAVVLIDEIDKADLDFPNDLLTVLDRPWAFEVSEVMETPADQESSNGERQPLRIGPAQHPPIVIITSNRERKTLPLPFLRRCIYYCIKFPNEAGLKRIIEAHYPSLAKAKSDTPLINAAIQKFIAVREQPGLFKYPGTSEFLDWIAALVQFGVKQKPNLLEQLQSQGSKPIPYREVLFKVQRDWDEFNPIAKGN
jgi:MoxR-like ATPase